MQNSLGKILLGIGLTGFLFFLCYSGNAIPVKELWFVLSFLVMAAGAYLTAKQKLRRSTQQASQSPNRIGEIQQLIQSGERVKVTLENSEVKTRSYQQEVIQEGIPNELDMLNALSSSNQSYSHEVVQQTYIVLYKEFSGQVYKFISPATSWDAVAVKMYMDREGGLDLYVDKCNPANYYFNFPFA